MPGQEKKSMRLDRFLADRSIGSRREVTAMIRRGTVSVDGKAVSDPGMHIKPGLHRVAVSGREIDGREFVYMMMNKPAGVLSATADSRGETVLDLLPPALCRRGLFPAGRLDKDTTGLLILTNDGDFAHRMLSPKKHVYKLYRATVARPVSPEDISRFEVGIVYRDTAYQPALLWTDGDDAQCAFVLIHEGKYHQVKRMFRACGNEVLQLKRLMIGGLKLDDDLKEGTVRELDASEVRRVFERNLYEKTQ